MGKSERYEKAFVDMLRQADKAPPERYVRTLDELIEFLAGEDDGTEPVPNGART